MELAGWLARTRLIDLLVLDLADAPPPRGLDRLADLLLRAGGTGLLLAGRPGREAAGRVAGVRVALARRAWLAVGQDLVGQRVEATVTRHRWALAGGHAELDLWFGEGRRIDPLLRSAASPREVPGSAARAAAGAARHLRLRPRYVAPVCAQRSYRPRRGAFRAQLGGGCAPSVHIGQEEALLGSEATLKALGGYAR